MGASWRRVCVRFRSCRWPSRLVCRRRSVATVGYSGALDDVRAQGALVVSLCPFIAGWIDRHADYQDLVYYTALDALDALDDPG